MTYPVPSLRQLVERAQADIDARLKGADARLFASNLNVLATTHAGAMDGAYRYLSWIKKQMFVKTCDEEQLAIRASELRIPRKPAVQASGRVRFAAVAGSVVAAEADLVRSDGVRYQSQGEAEAVGGYVTVSVHAIDAGSGGNMAGNAPLTLLTPVAGVQSAGVTDADGLGGGADIEGLEEWRDRLLRRMSKAPQGGSLADYDSWALEVPGVTRVWVSPHEMGAGTITVRFVRDNDESIIPGEGEVVAVQEYLDARRPVTVSELHVVAPVPVPLNFRIIVSPDNVAVKAAIESALTALIRREAVPGGTILGTHISEAISTSVGEVDHEKLEPLGNVMHLPGQLAVMGEIEWI